MPPASVVMSIRNRFSLPFCSLALCRKGQVSSTTNWSGLALAIALGSGWPTGNETQMEVQNQPTGYYHQAPAMNWSAGVMGSGLALAIDAAARVQHTHKTRPTMKEYLAVSWGRGVWVSDSDSVRVGLTRLFAGTHTLSYRRPVISACWILK